MNLAVLLAQIPPAIPAEKTLEEPGLFHVIFNAHPVVLLTFLILILFSVVSWAIIFYKFKQVKKAQNDAQDFWDAFSRINNLGELTNHRYSRSGPLYEIYNTALELMPRLKKSNRNPRQAQAMIEQKLTETREEEIYKLEQYTPFLATTASTAPFIGLFGTVVGILMAFYSIGKSGSSSLAVVGPYISEALIATAVGLAAAIPAVVAYNYFVHRTRTIVKMIDLFINDLLLKLDEETNP